MSHRAAVSGAALGGAVLAASLALLAMPACNECDSSIDPVKCTDLCTQDPPHEDCAQCTGDVKAENCPQCRTEPKARGCVNGDDGGAGTLSGGDGGAGGGGASGGSSGQGGQGGAGGVVGGQGGTAGDPPDAGPPPADCTTHADCRFDLPRCDDDGQCQPCGADDDACVGREERTICDVLGAVEAGICVECRGDIDCNPESTKPRCLSGRCEECASHADCDDSAKPQCNAAHDCVACDQATCDEVAPGTRCDDRPGDETSTEGQCVQCLTDADCENPTPECSAEGRCVACTSDAACAGRMDGATAIAQCNTRPGLATSGQCVHCTADNEADASGCGANACDQNLGACTSKARGQIKNPCVACDADSECETGMKCLRHVLNGEDLGTACFYAKSTNDGCSDTRSAVRPFSITVNMASLDGPAADYCLPPTSCLAYLDAIAGTGGKSCDSPDDCGVHDSDIDNALCIGAAPNGRCTYICEVDNECPSTDQSDCSATTGAGYCRP